MSPSLASERRRQATRLGCPGRLAQLVERLPYKQEVACSIRAPPISGKSSATPRGLAHPRTRRHQAGISCQPEPGTVDRGIAVSKLEDLQPGLRLAGVIPGQNVSVIAVQPHGDDAIELTYKTAKGDLGSIDDAQALLTGDAGTTVRAEG